MCDQLADKQSIHINKFHVTGGVSLEPCEGGSLVQWPEDGGQMILTGGGGTLGGICWEGATHLVLDITGLEDFNPVFIMLFLSGDSIELPSAIVNVGAIPGIRTRVAFPLDHLDSNRMFVPRTPGRLKEIVVGRGVALDEVKTFILTTKACHKSQKMIIHDIWLSWGKPEYTVPAVPLVDALGQSKLRQWPGKTPSVAALKSDLTSALAAYGAGCKYEGWSTYGGDLTVRYEATGYFRTQFDGNRWYLVDPEGYRFISTGLDCCRSDDGGPVSGIEGLFEELPDRETFAECYEDIEGKERTGGEYLSFAMANLKRAFGEEWRERWTTLTKNRLVDWHFNTIGNWSSPQFIKKARMPYVWPMTDFPSTKTCIFRDFPDVFSEEYASNAREFAKQLKAFAGDRYMIGYFMRNEPEWAFVQNLLIAEKVLENPVETVCKMLLIEQLCTKYEDIERLNQAWNKNYMSFEDLKKPQQMAAAFSVQARADMVDFSKQMIRKYVEVPSQACRAVDPDHMNLGMRYSMLTDPILLEGSEYFDVFSLNGYQESPYTEVQKAGELTGKPVLIGEFHFGAIDAGLPAAGICSVSTQKDRGLAYRYYYEQGMKSPYFVGAHYFILNDQPVLGRFDGENMQIGLVDVCNKPYGDFVAEVQDTNRSVYAMADGTYTRAEYEVKRIPRLMGF